LSGHDTDRLTLTSTEETTVYVLFWNPLLKLFVVRGVKSAGSYELPPEDGYWSIVDDSVGFFDAFVLMQKQAADEGWRNWEVRVEDAN
jgi:hypothetical protein